MPSEIVTVNYLERMADICRLLIMSLTVCKAASYIASVMDFIVYFTRYIVFLASVTQELTITI